METLRFIVKGQQIKKDPRSPFNRMVAGTMNYYDAEFVLDPTWNGYACVAKFRTYDVTVHVPIVNGKVLVPNNVMQYKEFRVSVVGKKGNTKLVTNETVVLQSGGKSHG